MQIGDEVMSRADFLRETHASESGPKGETGAWEPKMHEKDRKICWDS